LEVQSPLPMLLANSKIKLLGPYGSHGSFPAVKWWRKLEH
jgi:hypothetical protein